jgi:hypothetical protein
MCDAQGRDARVVHDGTTYPWPTDEASQYGREILGLTQETDRRRIHPGLQLSPRLIRSTGGLLPDPRVGDDAEKLVHARPRQGPGRSAFREFAHDTHGDLVLGNLASVSVDKNIGIDGEHGASPTLVDLVAKILPGKRIEWVRVARIAHAAIDKTMPGGSALRPKRESKSFLDQRTHRPPRPAGMLSCPFQKVVRDFDRCLHEYILPISHDMGNPYTAMSCTISLYDRSGP